MSNIQQMVKKCYGRGSVFLCLDNRTTSSDEIEVLPGLDAKVLMHGHPAGEKRKYLPTVVELECGKLRRYLRKRGWEESNI